MVHDESQLHYQSVRQEGHSSSVVRDDRGHIAYPTLVPPPIDGLPARPRSSAGPDDGVAHVAPGRPRAVSELPPRITIEGEEDDDAAAATVTGAGTGIRSPAALAPILSDGSRGLSKTMSRVVIAGGSGSGDKGDSPSSSSAALRRQLTRTRSRQTTASYSARPPISRAQSEVALIRELRTTPMLRWDLVDMPTTSDDTSLASLTTPASATDVGTPPQQSDTEGEAAAAHSGGASSFWRRKFGRGHKTKATKTTETPTTGAKPRHHTLLSSTSFRRDGRLPISIRDTSRTGVLAKTLGAAVQLITQDHSAYDNDEAMAMVEEEEEVAADTGENARNKVTDTPADKATEAADKKPAANAAADKGEDDDEYEDEDDIETDIAGARADPDAYSAAVLAAARKEGTLTPAAVEFGRVSHDLAHLHPPRLNIVIMVIGSRGDVQPFLKIGKVLKDKYGHRVRVATHPAFRDFIEQDAGLEFFSAGGDPAELMAFMVKNPGMIPSLATVRSGDIGRRRDAMAEMFDGFWRACVDATDDPANTANRSGGISGLDAEPFVADAIIANPPSYVHMHCAEALGIPLHIMFTFPYTPTQAFPHPLANIKKSNVDAGYTNFISYPLVEMMVWQGLGDLVNNFRTRTLGLDPISMVWAPGAIYRMHVPFTYLWSPGLVPKPADWGPEIDIGGFVFLDLASAFTPPPALEAFLDACGDEPPIYIGFGSIVVDDADTFTAMIFEAVRLAGVRALVSKGWGGLGGTGDSVPDNVYLLGNTPHDWLFPRVRACVIHGGAGTTAIALKCGLPTMVVPFFGDQYFWGSMIGRAHVGPAPVPYKHLTAERLADGIRYLLSDKARTAAQGIAAAIAQEGDGADNACLSFMRTLDLEGENSMRCAIFPDRVAVWQRHASNIKLSALAAEALVSRGYMSYKNLRLLRVTEWNDFEGSGEPITAMFGSLARSFRDVVTGPLDATRQLLMGGHKAASEARKRKRAHAAAAAAARAEAAAAATAATAKPTVKVSGSEGGDEEDQDEADAAAYANADLESPRASQETRGSMGSVSSSVYTPGSEARTKGEAGSFEVVFAAVGASVGRSARALALAPIDVYFALCQGFHNAPRLYGDDTVRRPMHVSGFHSGMVAAWNEFFFGIYDGVTGIVRLPLRHMRCGIGGPRGFARGLGMGLLGFVLKDISALIGPIGYALKGLAKQAERARHPARYIRRARMLQGQREVEALDAGARRRICDKAAAGWQAMHALYDTVQQEHHHHHLHVRRSRSGSRNRNGNSSRIQNRIQSRSRSRSWVWMHRGRSTDDTDFADDDQRTAVNGDGDVDGSVDDDDGLAMPALGRHASRDSVFMRSHYQYHRALGGGRTRQSLDDLDAALENADLAAIALAALRRGEALGSVVHTRHSCARAAAAARRLQPQPCHKCGDFGDVRVTRRSLNRPCRIQMAKKCWEDKEVVRATRASHPAISSAAAIIAGIETAETGEASGTNGANGANATNGTNGTNGINTVNDTSSANA